MPSLLPLRSSGGLPNLLDAYRSALADGYNRQVESGTFTHTTAQVMVGFLDGAVIGLRATGNEGWASGLEERESLLEADWQHFEAAIPALCLALDSR